MRKLISGKVRNTEKMEYIYGRRGNPNDCPSSFTFLMRDSRDGKFFLYRSDLDHESLKLVESPAKLIEECGWKLSDEEAERIAYSTYVWLFLNR